MKNIKCLRCNHEMEYIMTEDIQLGKESFLFGNWPNLLAGGLEVSIYSCPKCGKLEFFKAADDEEKLPQVKCKKCGKEYDFDYPKCPYCG